MSFGDDVLAEAKRLGGTGLDANQIAGVLCKKDPQGKNYGIGILLGGDGKPMATSSVLRDYVEQELRGSARGVYLNSDAVKKDITEAVLRWQGVPEALWPHFQLLLPSDAGTGAVQTAVQAAAALQDGIQTLAVEELGWPAYKAIAASARLGYQEFSADGAATGKGVLPLYQAGPLNTTGRVPAADVVRARAHAARASGTWIVLDRAYSGFEYARRLWEGLPYAEVMRQSFQGQVMPFIEANVPFCLAVSPTKAFVTFSLRPCGLLLVFHPDRSKAAAITPKLTALIRARGSSFEHLVTRAFVNAFVKDRPRLEGEHAQALERCAAAERLWQTFVKGTSIEALFTDAYAGLFRNPRAKPEAPGEIYGAHLYPVFAEGRCRLNITGLPAERPLASDQISFFAKYCFL